MGLLLLVIGGLRFRERETLAAAVPFRRSTLCRRRSSAPFPFLVFLLLLIVSLPFFDMRVVSGPFGLQIPDLAVYHSLRVSGATAS